MSSAQEVVICQICKENAERICETCKVDLCENCIGHHVRSNDESNNHSIVRYQDRKCGTLLENLQCLDHKQNCVIFCQVCNRALCPKCLALKIHKNHELVEISSAIESRLATLEKETEELEQSFEPGYEKIILELKTLLLLQEKCHTEIKEHMEKQGQRLRQALDTMIETYTKQEEENKERDIEDCTNLISKMENNLEAIKQLVEFNKNIIKSKNVHVLTHISKNETFREFPALFELTASTFSSGKIIPEQLQKMFGELSNSIRKNKEPQSIISKISLLADRDCLKTPEIIRRWETGLKVSPKVCCLHKSKKCFVRSGVNIKCFDNKGQLLGIHVLKPENHFLIDISVTSDNHLVYSDNRERSISKFKNIEDNNTERIITLNGWKPLALCCSSKDDLLVTMQTDDEKENKVVRYEGSKAIQEIQYKNQNIALYSNPLFICENTNFDICVSDWDQSSVVVVDSSGEFMFAYIGNRELRRYKNKFSPRGLACDALQHILVSDFLNNIIHIVNHNGHFLRFIDNCDLYCPQDLSISCDNELYVVCNSTDILKVISYLNYDG